MTTTRNGRADALGDPARIGAERARPSRRQVEAAFAVTRARAMGASTVRLRWWLRGLPAHSADDLTLARRRAIVAELHDRGAR